MRRPALAALVAGVCAFALFWPLRDGAGRDAARGAVGFSQVSLSTCSDWRSARMGDRLRLVADLGDHFGHASHIWGGARLVERDARRMFEAACARPEARNIKLYKLYSRALAFGR